jgi:RNA polymerase sigma factor (sigma-70 family)
MNLPVVQKIYDIRHIDSIPTLSNDESNALVVQWKLTNDTEYINKLIYHHLRYVKYIANQMSQNNGLDEDLFQVGCLALYKAAHNYDVGKGASFISFATFHIKGIMRTFKLSNNNALKTITTKSLEKLHYNYNKFFELHENRQSLSYDDAVLMAEKLNVELEDVRKFEEIKNLKFDCVHDDEEVDIVDYRTPDRLISSYQHDINCIDLYNDIIRFVKTLSERDFDIFKMRRIDNPPVEYRTIGEKYGISFQRVHQLEQNILKKIIANFGNLVPSIING